MMIELTEKEIAFIEKCIAFTNEEDIGANEIVYPEYETYERVCSKLGGAV